MKFIHWLRPGLKLKRWIFSGLVGIIMIAMSMAYYFVKTTNGFNNWVGLLIGVAGLFIVLFSMKNGIISILDLVYQPSTLSGKKDGNKLDKKIYDKKILARGPKVVVIGGGTGLSVLLRGLKLFTSNITAIVTVADDGGGSGKLREDLGMLPPGDIRNCILALADMEPTMEDLLQYRFEEGDLKGQNFGNLLIASMNNISGNFEEAIRRISDVLAVTGKVLPVTIRDITLYAKLENGTVVKGESNIPIKSLEENSSIEKIFIKPKQAETTKEAIDAIEDADIVLLGPGSLYTSVIPNLLIKNIKESLNRTNAIKVYIPNVMSQPGETKGYTVSSYIEALLDHWKDGAIDYVIANTGKIDNNISEKYETEGAEITKLTEEDVKRLEELNINLITGDLTDIKKDYVRHDAVKLSKIIIDLVLQWKVGKDRSRIIDYFYIRDLIKKTRLR